MKLARGACKACLKNAAFLSRRYKSTQVPRPREPPAPPVRFLGINPRILRSSFNNESSTKRSGRDGQSSRHRYNLFKQLVISRFDTVLQRMGSWTPDSAEYRPFGIYSPADLDREAKLFRVAVEKAFGLAAEQNKTGRAENPLFWNLRNAFVRGDAAALSRELKYAFQSFVLRTRFSKAVTETHHKLADHRSPYEWYPATRAMQRVVHLHVGPTNSGKTYNALLALEKAKSGIYAGPLRLLAHEVYTRFIAKGKRCALITGEEQRIPADSDMYFSSCTVEMAPTSRRVDVAVIDEIQMIADNERGWAWTQAFLGIQAKELHLCGEERSVELIQKMCARMGDECVVHHYKRLNPLQTMNESLEGNFQNLQKGDAIISFSRVGLHTLKAGIEQMTGRRCAIVYGSLPPETRAQQAALFNDPDNEYDFLVASDAIGMGLNLEVKRIVFESATKFDGGGHRSLTIPEIKQIGGRAGRYRTANQAIKGGPLKDDASSRSSVLVPAPAAPVAKWGTPGFVTSMENEDLAAIREAFEAEAEPLRSAGLQPPSFIIERFYSYFPPNTPLSFVISRLRDMARMSETFHMCDLRDSLEIAELIQELPLSIYDRTIFLKAPVSLRDPKGAEVLKAMAKCVADMSGGHICDIKEIELEILDRDRNDPGMVQSEYLKRLEALHKAVTLYLWLSYRYTGVFQSQKLAFYVKSLVEEKITAYLENLSFVPGAREKLREVHREQARKQRVKAEKLQMGAESTTKPFQEGPGQWNEGGHGEPLVEDGSEVSTVAIEQRKVRAA